MIKNDNCKDLGGYDTINTQNDSCKSASPAKGDGTMSAATQNHVYSYGPKKAGVKDAHVLSTERLKEIKESLQKYRTEKK